MRKNKAFFLFIVICLFFFTINFKQKKLEKGQRIDPYVSEVRVRVINNGLPHRSTGKAFIPDQVLVKFKPSLSVRAIETAIAAYQTEMIHRIPKMDVYQLRIPESATVEEMVYVLSQNPDVEYAEPNYVFHIAVTPNDFYFKYQYALLNTGTRVAPIDVPGAPTGKSEADIKATSAWEETKGDEEVIIAVIDTGVDLSHPDIKSKIVSPGKDFINYDDDASDDQGHGTFVAGIIAAETDNNIGIAGVAWNCKILPIKAFGPEGEGDSVTITQAINWAIEQGVDVINMSFGGSVGLGKNLLARTIEDPLENAFNNGIVLVAAVGNETDYVLYPANSDYTLAVAATDSNDIRPTWSSFGPEVDVAAPGDWIVSLYPQSLLPQPPPKLEPYAWWGGTSMSTAHVSGLAALIKSIKPWLTVENIMNVIRYTADDVNSTNHPGKDDYIGYGRINMEKALVPIKISGSR